MLAEEPACRSPAAKAYGDGTQAGFSPDSYGVGFSYRLMLRTSKQSLKYGTLTRSLPGQFYQ